MAPTDFLAVQTGGVQSEAQTGDGVGLAELRGDAPGGSHKVQRDALGDEVNGRPGVPEIRVRLVSGGRRDV